MWLCSDDVNIFIHQIFFNEFDTFQGKCANLQSITVNATPALTAVPAKVVWSPIIATAHLVSTAHSFIQNINPF